MSEREPEVPFSVACRRFTPRSGYEFLQTLTGRTIAEMRWWNTRIGELMEKCWTNRSIGRIVLQDRDEMGWKPERES